jgi:hypothetical protein
MVVVERAVGNRSDLIRRAFILEWLTLAWVLLEAAVSIWAGLQAHSVSLVAFEATASVRPMRLKRRRQSLPAISPSIASSSHFSAWPT